MSSHLVFNGFDEATKADLEKYWTNKKLPRLHKLLASYPPERRDIWLTVYHHHQSPLGSWYEARAVLHLPTGTLVAEADEKDPEVVLDAVAAALAAKLQRHNERVRKEYVFKRKARQRADVNAVAPLLQRDVESERRDAFFQLLRPQLRFLRGHAGRELRILEQGGGLHRREVTVDDLLDEVLNRAWQRFADRPRDLPLDLWLTNLLHETLEQWLKQEPRPHISLEEELEKAPPKAVPPLEQKQEKQEKEWWDELPPFEERALLEDLIPDREEREPWEELETAELRDRLLSLLGELPPAQRQAFLLHALEDYSPAEIAMLQNRPESQVKADIEAARKTLRDRLLADGNVQEPRKPARASAAAPAGGN